MLTKTNIIHDSNEIYNLVKHFQPGKNPLNSPTGNFFYDPWETLPEFKDTSIDVLLQKLPNIGEARINVLEPGESYMAHADIDDRYHLHLDGDYSFLCDLDNDKIYRTDKDNIVYSMDTSRIHTASNYGYKRRYQLVVRKLLVFGNVNNPVKIQLTATEHLYNLRYLFDNSFSILLNKLNKDKKLQGFKKVSDVCIEFEVDKNDLSKIEECRQVCGFDTRLEYL